MIADATVELGPGLTVVTGETGAGKTMVVTGLQLLFGGRGDSARVRRDAPRAVVEGRLRLPNGPALRRAAEAGADVDEDGTLLLSRSVSSDGRSRAHLGGRSVPVGVLAELAADVLAVHGQSDQARLLRPAAQRAALDRFGGPEVEASAVRYAVAWDRWRAATAEWDERTGRAAELAQEAELLRFGLDRIAGVDPQPGEELALDGDLARLQHADLLHQAARDAHTALAGDGGDTDVPDVSTMVGSARRALGACTGLDEELTALETRVAEIGYLTADVAADLAAYAESVQADPERLQRVLDRRSVLRELLHRYGASTADVLAWADRAGRRLLDLDTSDDALRALAERRDDAAAAAALAAGELSRRRLAAAERFGAEVGAELDGLAMPAASVRVEVRPRPPVAGAAVLQVDGAARGAGPEGTDDVELLLAAGPGSPPLPLHRGASGGELSRVMLAVEVVFAAADPVPVMVFDEVDAGVGGRAAIEVGRRLARLSRDRQVFVVTHLPQVAAFADVHLMVDRTDAEGAPGAVTGSAVRRLDDAGRLAELARMLAGQEGSEHARRHAAELVGAAALERAAARG